MKWTGPPRAWITKKQKEQALQELRQYDQKTEHTPAEERDHLYTLQCITTDHQRRLLTDLKHIAQRPLLDMLISDSSDTEYQTADYLRRYDDYELEELLHKINDARQALDWLQELTEAEQIDRWKRQGNVIPFKGGTHH